MTVSWMGSDDRTGVSIRMRATSPDGRVFFDGVLKGTATFDVPPGEIDVQRTIIGGDGASLGSRTTKVTVPDYGRVPLALLSPRVFRARTGIELREIEANSGEAPFAGHEFDRTDRVVIRVALAGVLVPSASLRARLLNKGGAALADLPLTRRSDGQDQTALTIASFARGEYLVEFTAVAGEAHAQALVPLRVR